MAIPGATGPASFTLAALVLLLIGWRSWRMGRVAISIHSDHVAVHNILKTHRLPWEEIQQISIHLVAPPDDLLRGLLGLPPDEDSVMAIPEHRRMVDSSDGVTKFLMSITIATAKRQVSCDAVTVNAVEALALAWATEQDARRGFATRSPSEWEKVIPAQELAAWFQQEGPKGPHE
jgi:hypothetical protein